MERKTAATMIAERYGCNCHEIYTSRRMVDPECTLHSEGEEIEELMSQYADQEKEAEAVEFQEYSFKFRRVTRDLWDDGVGILTTKQLYGRFQIFKQQTGGK